MNSIYLDHNATTPPKPEVLSYMQQFYAEPQNPSSIHSHGRMARKLIEHARCQVKICLGFKEHAACKVIFTSSGSEANNLMLYSFSKLPIITSSIEHHSILKSVVNDTLIAVDENGLVDLRQLENQLKLINGKKLVSIMLANNETGVINDLAKIAELCHLHDAYIHTDASAAIGKISVNMMELGVDLMTISAHKFGGPMGAAALIANEDVVLSAQIKGGGQEQGIRSGTENVPAIIGFGLACKLAEENVKKMQEIATLRDEIEQQLAKHAELHVFGQKVARIPNTSCLTMPGVSSDRQLIHFDLKNISVSSGAACSSGRVSVSHVLLAMGVSEIDAQSAIRVSLGYNTTKAEIQYFIDVWQELCSQASDITGSQQ